MQINFAGSPAATGPLVLTNRQTNYVWNDDFFEVVALGYDTTSAVGLPSTCLNTLAVDADGATQYRWQVPLQSINLKPPWAADSSLIATNDVRWGAGSVSMTLGGATPYPRYPHVVLRYAPSAGPNYPDTTLYAPPANATDINASGALTGQADYYSAAAWTPRNDAPLLVNTATQHPTQLWIGTPDMPPGTMVQDALLPANYFPSTAMRGTGSVGYEFGPTSPSGAGRSYTHTLGSAPGGVLWAMATAWVQEFYGYDMRVMLCLGSQECGAGLFYDGSGGFTPWQWAGDACANSTLLGDSYQMINADVEQCIMAFPDYWPHNNSYLDGPSFAGLNGQVVNSTVAMALDLSSRYYGYFAPARSLDLSQFAAAASDPYALFRICAYAYNMGPHDPNVWQFACGASRAAGEAAPNLSNAPFNVVGNSAYGPHVVDLAKRIGSTPAVWDYGIAWGDVQDFMADLRTEQYANGEPTAAQWAALMAELSSAFNAMQGKVPAAQQPPGYGPTSISFRYNWLTLLRIMKKYLPNPHLYLPKGDWNNQVDFTQPYQCFTAGAEEISPLLCSTNNLAPQLYWVSPTFGSPSLAQAFPVIQNVCSNLGLTLTADVLDDGVGGTPLTLRYAISPGDPSTAAGGSQFLDGTSTGGTLAYPAGEDWTNVPPVGASSAPAGGTRFSTLVNISALSGNRRIYLEADDHNGYQTLGWVDVSIVNCSLFTPTPTPCTPDLALTPGPNPVNCFPSAASIAGISAGNGTVSWAAGPADTNDTVGALHYNYTGANFYYGALFTVPVSQGNLNGYTQICASIWNQAAGSSPTVVLMAGTQVLSTAGQTLAPGSGFSSVCWNLDATKVGTVPSVTFLVSSATPLSAGDIYFDDITLVDSGGVTHSDPRCCPANPPSPTPSDTATPTPTVSPTASASPCPTPSRTPTPSLTATPSPSSSATRTASATLTPSASATATATGSLTASTSPSFSPSPSVSVSPSASSSPSPSLTLTPSASLTASPSQTPSLTASATPSVSATDSPSAIATASFSPSPTLTVSASLTSSPTQTATLSPSATLTGTLTASPTCSATASTTPSPTLTPSASLTATPTQTTSFSPSPSPSVTPTSSPSETQTRTWTQTPSQTASPSATPTRTVTPTLSPSPSPTASASVTQTFTDSPSVTVSPTVTPTAMPMPFTVNVAVFNASGEKVDQLFQGTAAAEPNGVALDRTLLLEGGAPAVLSLGAALSGAPGGTLSWGGVGSNGQWVAPGVYTILLSFANAFGQTTNFPVSVQVLAAPSSTLQVFDSAGELVGRVDLAAGLSVAGFSLSKTAMVAAWTASGAPVDPITGSLALSTGGARPFSWDGRSLSGQPLAPGVYTLVLKSATPSGTQVSSRGITILAGPAQAIGDPFVCPNPGSAGSGLGVRYPAGLLLRAQAYLYSLSGERVATATDPGASGLLWLDCGKASAGVYLVLVEGRLASGASYRKVVKAALVH